MTVSGQGPIRLGLVGCGWISEWHGRAAAATEGVALVACCDIRQEAAEGFARRFGCERAYTDYLTMIREHDLDAVLLATWPPQHHEQIIACLEAGIRNILCEKSLAYSSSEAMALWTAVKDADALLVEGLMWRHHPAIRKVDELIASGEIGAVDYINTSFDYFDAETASADDPTRDWRQRKETAGGVAYDVTCYCIDACNHFAGSLPRQVMALTGTSTKYDTVNRVFGVVEYENGRAGILATSSRSNFNYEVKVNGASGQIVVPNAWRIDSDSELYLHRSTDLFRFDTTEFAIPEADSYTLQLQRFIAAVDGGASADPALAESVVNSLVADALLRSGDERAAVMVEVPEAVRAELAGVRV
jgi:D-xylose 1-dehydrogenase (NADP+, D-xylono-1,5-lactone-forming)